MQRGGSDDDGVGGGACTNDELAMDEALAMPPTSLVRKFLSDLTNASTQFTPRYAYHPHSI